MDADKTAKAVFEEADLIFPTLIGTWHVYVDAYFLQDTWGNACHDKTGQYAIEGYTYNIFTAQIPGTVMTLFDDGTIEWGYLPYTVEASGDWYKCSITGPPDNINTGNWTYRRNQDGTSYVSVPIPYSGGGTIVEPQTEMYEWIYVSPGRNENYGYRWVKQ